MNLPPSTVFSSSGLGTLASRPQQKGRLEKILTSVLAGLSGVNNHKVDQTRFRD